VVERHLYPDLSFHPRHTKESISPPSHIADRLLTNLLVDLRLDPPVLLRGDVLSHLPVRWIPTEHVRVENRHAPEHDGRGIPEDVAVRPAHARHETVKQHAIDGMEEESEVDGDQGADEFELRLEAANEDPPARCVNGRHPDGNVRDADQLDYLWSAANQRMRGWADDNSGDTIQ
jgi:hypothetical protein